MQEGIVRAKLEKILRGYEDVHYEASYATGESIKAVSSFNINIIHNDYIIILLVFIYME